jgi:hypothetical protein
LIYFFENKAMQRNKTKNKQKRNLTGKTTTGQPTAERQHVAALAIADHMEQNPKVVAP